MYDDNVTYRVGINWKDILIKLIMLILFVIILLLLFPKADLDVFYDSVYSNNVNTMKAAARNYYTLDRLPSNVGDKTSMTLKEMVDNHMLIRFTDKDGKTCDESASYVEVTKISKDEYTLKVQLKCGEQEDYILETIGCTTVCSNGTCNTVITDNGNGTVADNSQSNNNSDDTVDAGWGETTGDIKGDSYVSKVTYYQHRKKITTETVNYTCPEGYLKNGTKCTKTATSASIDGTPIYNPDQVVTTDALYNAGGEYRVYADYIKTQVGIDYTCPTGYTLNGIYCIKYTTATEVPGGVTYTCPTGYTKNGTKCTKVYDATYNEGSTSYSCPNGGTLNGTKCTLTTTATSTTEYTCPTGYTKNGSSCYKVYDAKSSTTYSCPNGGTLNGTKCVTSGSSYNAKANTTYSCPNGGTLSGTKCVTSGSSYNATATTTYGSWKAQGTQYYTSAGKAYQNTTSWLQLNGMITGAACGSPCGGKGTWYKYTYYTRSADIKYSCPNGGTLNGTKCVTSGSSYNATAKTTYTCPNGGTLSGTKCVTSGSTYDATPSTSYSCPNGGTRNGSKCTITVNATANTIYSCPTGYTRSGTTCTKVYDATKNTGNGYYTCPNGGTIYGNKCTITRDADKVVGETTYTCPEGYTYNKTLNKCEHSISANATAEYAYSCPTGYIQEGTGVDTKCYKLEQGEGNYYCADASAVLTDKKCVKTVKGGISHYTCPTGYTLNDTKCTKTTTDTVDAQKEVLTNTSYKYKWSKSSTLEGWEFTGKTKVVEESYKAGQK